jgi:hypothetical protein
MNDNLYTVPQYALEHMQSKYRRAVTRNYPALGVNAGSIGFLSTTAGSSGDTTYSNQQETPNAMPYSLADEIRVGYRGNEGMSSAAVPPTSKRPNMTKRIRYFAILIICQI